MKQEIAMAFLCLILIGVILVRVRERYTTADAEKLEGIFSGYTGPNIRDDMKKSIVQTIISELGNDTPNKLSNVNFLVDTLNTGRSNTWSRYSSVEEVDTMFETAFTSGESGMSDRDRMVLRAIALPAIGFTNSQGHGFTITYTSEDVPDYATTIINESGKTSKEMLLFCFKLIEKIFESDTWTPDIIDYINSYIPDRFAPKYDRNSGNAFETSFLSDSPDDKTIWLWKAILLGPAYISKLAENKWKLDLDWTPPA
jgi:hypothetical protein